MPDYTGSIGLDISEFEKGIADLANEIPQLETELRQLNAQIAIMERSGKSSGAEYQRLTRVQKELGVVLGDSKRQMASFTEAIGPQKTGLITRGLTSISAAAKLVGITLGVGAFIAATKSLLDFGKQVRDTATVSGVLPQSLLGIQSALSDKLGADDTYAALHTLNALMRETKAGSAEAQDKLSQLGITFEDIKSKSPDEVLLKLADYVKNAKDPVEALRAVTNAFGSDLGAKLIPALSKGADEIKILAKNSITASNEIINAASEGGRALSQWEREFKIFGLTVAGVIRKIVDFKSEIKDAGAATILKTDNAELRETISQLNAIAELRSRVNQGGVSPIADIKNRMITSDLRKKGIQIPLDMSPGDISKMAQKMQENEMIANLPKAPAIRGDKGGARGRGTSSTRTSRADESGPLGYQVKLQRELAEIAKSETTPEYEKQRQILEAHRKATEAELELKKDQNSLEVEVLKLKSAQLDEALRAVNYAQELRDVQIESNLVQASVGRGYYAEQASSLAKLAALNKQFQIARATGNEEEAAAVMKSRRDEAFAMIARHEGRRDSLRALNAETKEMEAQQKGLLEQAKAVAAAEKYQQGILQAIREQNSEAAALLIKQKAINTQASQAAQKRLTPREKAEARRAGRIEASDAAKQRAREDEAERRQKSGKSGRGIDELVASKQARLAAEKEIQDESGKTDSQRARDAGAGVDPFAGPSLRDRTKATGVTGVKKDVGATEKNSSQSTQDKPASALNSIAADLKSILGEMKGT
ncbi:MAG: hypothetical protein WC069_06170 [Candidatus Shapirobacteria bacterium]